MPDEHLTPVERGTLLALMAAGGPLRENADLKATFGIALKASHRAKLQRLGLVETSKGPLAHRLSEKGWEWAQIEIGATKPKGQMGMGPLYAVLGGLKRHIESHGLSLSDMFVRGSERSPAPPRSDLHEAAWSEADEALGQALQDMHIFTRSLDKLREAASGDFAALAKRSDLAANLVLQSVRLAAKKRELSLVPEPGAETAFDPVSQLSDEAVAPGDRVRVRKGAVFRGAPRTGVVVVKGEVEPI